MGPARVVIRGPSNNVFTLTPVTPAGAATLAAANGTGGTGTAVNHS
jgi:hypothetical protein